MIKKIILSACIIAGCLYFENIVIAEETAHYFKKLGDSYKEQNENSKALEAYKKAITLEPNIAEAHSALGSLYGRLKEYDKAIEELELSIKLNSELSTEVIPKLIWIYLFKENPKASEYFKKLTEISPETALEFTPHIFNARIYGIKEVEDGLEVIVPLLELPDGKLRDRFHKVDSFIETKEYTKAIKGYQEILDTENLSPKEKAVFIYTIGMIYITQIKDIRNGITYIKQAIEIYPDERTFWASLVDAYLSTGKYSKALEELEKFIEIKPNDKYGLFFQGVVNFKLQKYREAIQSWDKLKEIDPILFVLIEEYYLQSKRFSLYSPDSSASLSSPPPSATESEYFKTSIAGFDIANEKPAFIVRYILGLDVIGHFNDTVFVEIEFENPTNKKYPVIVPYTLKANDTQLVVKSPPIHGLQKEADYIVTVKVYPNKEKKKIITKHIQKIRSSFDEAETEELMIKQK